MNTAWLMSHLFSYMEESGIRPFSFQPQESVESEGPEWARCVLDHFERWDPATAKAGLSVWFPEMRCAMDAPVYLGLIWMVIDLLIEG